MAFTYRSVKGSLLTAAEVDANFAEVETKYDATVVAKDAAETARTGAEAAETNASASASAASTSETNAAASASAASTSETNAAAGASAASTSETNAAASETNAAASAVDAQSSQVDAETAQTAAEAARAGAETAEANAVAVVYSGGASLTPGAGKIPVADADGYIDQNWTKFPSQISARQISQAINMTAASSGSNGIKVLNDDNINFGTGDFTLVWKGSLPDWSGTVRFMTSRESPTEMIQAPYCNGGILSFYVASGGTAISELGTENIALADNESALITMAYTRESASQDGYVRYYVNDSLFDTITISAGTPIDISFNAALEICGYNGARYASTTQAAILYNRALDADDVAYLYKNGIHPADMWGSQTELNTGTWANSTLGSREFTSLVASGSDGFTADYNNANATNRALCSLSTPTVTGKKYKLSYTINTGGVDVGIGFSTEASTGEAINSGTVYYATKNTAVATDYEVEFTASGNVGLALAVIVISVPASGSLSLSNVSLVEIGATAAYLPENIQPVPGQWLDASSNKLHALMPAAGCTLMRPENEFEIRWTNTWAGTSEMQYIGGTNQAVLPEGNIRIEYITMTCTATGVSITIGDGSDADRFVTSTALADYLDISSPTKRNHDGTNRDMTITPSGAYTGSITTTVVGKILD
jgi:hypothetical protein